MLSIGRDASYEFRKDLGLIGKRDNKSTKESPKKSMEKTPDLSGQEAMIIVSISPVVGSQMPELIITPPAIKAQKRVRTMSADKHTENEVKKERENNRKLKEEISVLKEKVNELQEKVNKYEEAEKQKENVVISFSFRAVRRLIFPSPTETNRK